MLYFSTILLSVFVTVSLIPVMTRLAGRFQIVDLPDPRKVHTSPIPRIGGLAMAIGAVVPVLLWLIADDFVRAYLAGAGTLVIFGLMDDIKGLGYKAKFGGQVLAALVVIFYGSVKITSLGMLTPGLAQLPDWFAITLTLLAIVGVTNAINLSDGLDGLAGGISLLSFCCIGYLAHLAGNNAIMLLSLSLAGAIFGFLRFNTHPASLFMGDTGSQLLGFSAVVLAVKITQGNTPFSPILPLIILGFPILDTLTVMAERFRDKRPLFSADKNHFHHRLIRFGLSHADAVFAIYVIQAIMIVCAIRFRYYSDWALLISYAVFSTLIIMTFVVADRTGYRFKWYPLIDQAIKGRLRKIRDDRWIIRVSFSVSKTIIPLILLFSCMLPARIPGYVSVITGCFSLLLLAVWLLAKKRMDFWLRFVLYMTIPLVLYFIEGGRAGWVNSTMVNAYYVSFGIVAFFVLLTMQYSGRTKGFRMSTMDFLIIFIAVVVPNLPDQPIQSHHLGLLAVEIIVMLFSYEVLLTELRKKYTSLTICTLLALMLLGVRGGLGV